MMSNLSPDVAGRLAHLLEDEMWQLRGERDRLIETYSETIPRLLARVSEMTGISEESLLSLCVRASHHHANMTWWQILSVLNDVYTARKQLEEKDNHVR